MRKLVTDDGRIGKLLLVDDDEVDVLGFKRELKRAGIATPVTVAHNGEEALAILRGEDGAEKLIPPYIVFLDLNMPRMGGLEFLGELRADADLRRTIVFVLTTSAAESDMELAYAHNIAGYICKTTPEDSVKNAVRLMELYWSTVQLPQAG